MKNTNMISYKNSRIKTRRSLLLPAGLIMMLALTCSAATAEDTPLYKQTDAPVEQRVGDLLGRMTLEEKLEMVHGDVNTGMDTKPIERLGIPRLSMTDGPHGVRHGKSTCFPTGVTLGSTWNEELLEKIGVGLARDALAKGRNVLLGPCINMHRAPFGGRNFESFSEDPYLAARLAVGYVKGVQSQHVVATPKHYAVNNQEWARMTISAEIDERTLREIYLPHFKAAVQEGGSWSIMGSYNRINGIYACENKFLMTEILKDEWGFQGFAMSDWGAVHSTVETVMSGLDLEMPAGAFLGKKLKKAVKDGKVPESTIDEMVRRILRVMFVSGIFDGKAVAEESWKDPAFHRELALEAAREGIVLLKNDGGVLPVDRGAIRSIAIIGPNAKETQLGGGGSSLVSSNFKVSPFEGITELAGDGVEIRYAKGCDLHVPVKYELISAENLLPAGGAEGETGLLAEYFSSQTFEGEPVISQVEKQVDANWGSGAPAPELDRNNFSVRWEGTLTPPVSGKYRLVVICNDGSAHLYINKKPKVNVWALNGVPRSKTISSKLKAGKSYNIRFEYKGMGVRAMVKLGWVMPGQDPIADAAKLAAESDVAIVVVGLDRSIEGEGNDRESLELPGLQNDLIEAVAAANPNTAVVLINGTPLIMDRWLDKVPAVIEAWYPGQEGGQAIAEILFGDVNPSGKLSTTLLKSWEKSPAYGNYPGEDGKLNYEEGIFIGYRYFDRENIEPFFPFGHGLSYTSFEYSGLAINPEKMSAGDETVEVILEVKNTGSRAGKEVVQLYVSDLESSVERPVRELKGIRKIHLEPGESKKVVFEIDRPALSFFDPQSRSWTAEPGTFEIQIGASSRDIRLKGDLVLE